MEIADVANSKDDARQARDDEMDGGEEVGPRSISITSFHCLLLLSAFSLENRLWRICNLS